MHLLPCVLSMFYPMGWTMLNKSFCSNQNNEKVHPHDAIKIHIGVCYPIWFVFLPPPLPLVYQQQAQQLLYPDLKRHFMCVKPETPSPEPTTSVVILPFCLTVLHLYARKKSKRTGTSHHPLKKDVTESRQFDAIDVGNLFMIGRTHPLRHRQGLSSGHRPRTLSKEDWLCLSRFLLPNEITNPNNWWFH